MSLVLRINRRRGVERDTRYLERGERFTLARGGLLHKSSDGMKHGMLRCTDLAALLSLGDYSSFHVKTAD